MARTEVNTKQVGDGEITRADLNITESSKAVIARIIAGSGIQISSTGADTGTGDVTITATGGGNNSVAVKTSDYTITTDDKTILIDAGANTVTVTLPTAVGNTGTTFNIKCKDSTYQASIATNGSQTINELTSVELTKGDAVQVISDGANWQVI